MHELMIAIRCHSYAILTVRAEHGTVVNMNMIRESFCQLVIDYFHMCNTCIICNVQQSKCSSKQFIMVTVKPANVTS